MSGASISVYHSFTDEVDVYRVHWWQCGGPCKDRGPYFGLVKRATNRAPSHNDPWWSDHLASCGGTYTKIREPEAKEKPPKRKSKDAEVSTKGQNTIEMAFQNQRRKKPDTGPDEAGATAHCPACGLELHEAAINAHLDACLE